VLRELHRLAAIRARAEREITASIRLARDYGITWDEIGKQLGMTGQGALQWLKRHTEE